MFPDDSPSARKDYLGLLKVANRLIANDRELPVIRVAILGDHATQQLSKVFRAVLHELGIWGEIYEAEFDTLQHEILDPESGMHQFAPNYVWICLCSQQYKRRFMNTPAESLPALPEQWARDLGGLMESLGKRGCQIIINNLAPPRERFFGNFALRTSNSVYASTLEANRRLVELINSIPQSYVNDVAFLASRAGLDQWYDDRLWIHSKYPCAPLHFAAMARSAAGIILVTRGRLTKCVALDLDNTLWGGVIGDDGLEKIEIGGFGAGEAFEEFQRYLLQLKNRGILLAVCSKNDEANARLPFQRHTGMALKESDIAAFVANWEPKSDNLRRISRMLNIGLDSFVFVDDSAFERNEVRLACPEVAVPELPEDVAEYAACLEAGGYFETTTFTEDDQRRTAMYREEVARADLRERVTNMDDYLGSLEMKMSCRPFDAENLQRIAQLIQRSNQFNLRTQRYSETQCSAFMEAPDQFPAFHFSLRDKYGNYGLISVVCCEVAETNLEIKEWVMSCRVLNRGVEERILGCLIQRGRELKLAALRGEYLATPKNKMVSRLYERLGFSAEDESADASRWFLPLENYLGRPTHIELES